MMTRSEVPAEFLDQPAPSATDVWANRPKWHATQKQIGYIASLVAERELPAEAAKSFADRITAAEAGDWERGIRFERASDFITRLLALPKKKVTNTRFVHGTTVEYIEVEPAKGDKDAVTVGRIKLADGRTLLPGSYGLDTSADDRFKNNTSFFKVWAAEGYGKGWGVKLYVSDDTSKVKLAGKTETDVIEAIIAAGPAEASALFGHEFEHCGVCGRGLTKDDSRARGIGPVCARRLASF